LGYENFAWVSGSVGIMTSATYDRQRAARPSAGPLAIGSWMLFDWAAQPFYTLVTTFLFAPYFAAVFIGDAAQGGAIWGYTMAAASVLVALGSPVLGAIADRRGRLKQLIGWLSISFVLGQLALWYAVPGGSGNLWIVVLGLIAATVSAEFSAVLNNSLMPRLVPPRLLGRVSGGGWALGYAGGLISLIIMAAFVMIDAGTGQTVLGLAPLISFDVASHEADRFVGPFAALWFVVFVIPFFLFTPDAPPKPGAERATIRSAFASIAGTLRHIGRYRDLALFFAARMLFIDGLLAIFTFGGIYAKALFDWPTIVIGYFGIILSVAAGIGAAAGGFLDDRLGSKRVLVGALLLLICGAAGVISIDARHVLFFIEVTPRAADAAPFTSTGERVYIAFAILIGLSSGPLQSASRSLLARMAPPEHMSEFFGFFAFSGKVTAFAAPLIIGIVASMTGSLQIAMSVILLFLFSGLIIMGFVRTNSL
jgi:UMF1 family MFS transporter